MAFFADLGDDEFGRADGDASVDLRFGPVDAARDDVFSEGTGRYFESQGSHPFDRFNGKKRDLTVPGSGVGVSADAETRHDLHFGNVREKNGKIVVIDTGYHSLGYINDRFNWDKKFKSLKKKLNKMYVKRQKPYLENY